MAVAEPGPGFGGLPDSALRLAGARPSRPAPGFVDRAREPATDRRL